MTAMPAVMPANLEDALLNSASGASPAEQLDHLVDHGCDVLPLPGGGQTLARWQALARVAAHDLSLVKLFEGHTDALAILAELGTSAAALGMHRPGQPAPRWGVWASEAPGSRVIVKQAGIGSADQVRLYGVKSWCSGAEHGSHALLTAWHEGAREPQLVAVAMAQPGVAVSSDQWQAVGMSGSASLQVTFDGALARPVGRAGAYLSRPGFWQGGAGIAACWYGGATAVARVLHRSVSQNAAAPRNAFRLAAAGKVDVMLQGARAMLHDAARWIDQHPFEDASETAFRVRLAAARCAGQVLEETGAALGASPYCHDAAFARMAADLPVFIRQSHGNRDYAALGDKLSIDSRGDPWDL